MKVRSSPSRRAARLPALALLAAGRSIQAQDLEGGAATVRNPRSSEETRGRSHGGVTRADLEERAPRSSPEALRFVPGVTIQQTAHGQASPFVRGVTGQQVLLMFDGVRLNTGVYRQGPNQHFFTVDSQSVEALEVLRGSASVRWGSDAIGGVVLVTPRGPTLDPTRSGLTLHPALRGRYGTADGELGGRAELDAQLGRSVAVLVGGGYRDVGALQSSGAIGDLATGRAPPVPYFEPDGRTQRGTGFQEGTFDARAVLRLRDDLQAVAAVYGYRQYDAPRTDLCPPAYGSERECLRYEEQFRTLAYAALRGHAGRRVRDLDVVLSYQRSHERRRLDRPLSSATNGFLDDVDTLGVALRAATPRLRLAGTDARPLSLRLRYGVEAYRDAVASASWITFTDVGVTRPYARGQYADGATMLQGGAWTEAELSYGPRLRVRAGARVAAAGAWAAGDAASATQPVDSSAVAALGRAGLEWHPNAALRFFVNVDQGFRVPNLDDLTSRQQAGPGFQFENVALGPERSLTWELGARVRLPGLELEAWGYAMTLDGAITRALRSTAECPAMTPQCDASWSRFQLVNSDGTSVLLGAEGAARVLLPRGVSVAATVAYAWGDGPALSGSSGPRVPLSRIPPLNGTVEARWRHAPSGIYLGAALRWAADQTRLAPSDLGDARIPAGGTPGYAVVDLRAGWRWRDHLRVGASFENALDSPYRVHGSSVNGPGRSLLFTLATRL